MFLFTKSYHKMKDIGKAAKSFIQKQIDNLSTLMGTYKPEDLFHAIEAHKPSQLKQILKNTKTRFQYQIDKQGSPPICKAAELGYEDYTRL